MVDVTEILNHWHAGRSQSEIATSLGVDRKTVKKYLVPALQAGIVPGSAPRTGEAWAEPVRSWWPGLVDTRLRQTTWQQIEVYHQFVVDKLAAGVTQARIWQRLRDEHGLTANLASLKRYVAANLPEDVLRSRVTVLRDTPAAGQEAQIDYGYLGSWLDPVGARLRRVWAFVMVLACSRHVFVRPVLRMDQQAWTQAHVEAFTFFGGVPARLVPDNLRTGVERPDLYDPKINRCYAELAEHYATLIDPARVRKTQGQGAGGAANALSPGLVLARPGVHVAGADAGGGAGVMHRGCRGAFVSAVGWRGTVDGVPHGQVAGAETAATWAFRARDLVAGPRWARTST